MKHLKTFDETNESLKDTLAAGIITLASILPNKALSQDLLTTWNSKNIEKSIKHRQEDNFSKYNLPRHGNTKLVKLTADELSDVIENLMEKGFSGRKLTGEGTFIISASNSGNSENDVVSFSLLPCFKECRIINQTTYQKGRQTVTIARVEYKFKYYYDLPVSRKEIKNIEKGRRHTGDSDKTFAVSVKTDKGQTEFKVVATTEDEAKEIVCNAKKCSPSDIISVTQKHIRGLD